jgi:hypothetical protein
MPLPPKGDPQRPLELAIRSVRLLAVLLLLLSTCVGIVVVPAMSRAAHAATGRTSMVTQVIAVAALLVYFGPGVVYLVLTVYLRQRAVWAVTTGIVIASVQLLILLLGVVAMLVRGPTNMVGICIGGLFIVALAQLIQQLSQSYAAVRAWRGDTVRGFEPLPIVPVAPPSDPTP